jgi:transcriptional regulator with PAS, ATPase and Fis domain
VDSTVTGGEPGAAGDDRDWALLVSGAGMSKVFVLPGRGEVVIGRDAACEVALDHERLSRRHARIAIGERWTLEDLGSRNGTHLRGAKLAAPTEIVPGEPIAIGPFTAVIVSRAVSTARSVVGGSHVAISDPTLAEPTPLLVAVARSPVSIVIGGETGVGKEVLAQALHRLSNRPGPILAINCAAIAPALLESELFGHVRGAFTGAVADKPGLLEAAAGGTVLFDEIGELPLDLQAKLLRAIETREVVRVGAVRPAAVNVRFLAATHKDLVAASQTGEFRRDLFYRLAGITLTIAPLRERPHQIAALASKFAREVGGVSIGAAALARLATHDWPGNVRELRNVIERAALLAAGGDIGPEHILLDTSGPRTTPAAAPADDLPAEQAAERDRIIAALDACAGNQSNAAKQLGISRANLVNKLALYRVPRPRDKKR